MDGMFNGYSLSKNGNDFISPHFQVKEFKQPGKVDVVVSLGLIHRLEALSDCINNKPIYIVKTYNQGDLVDIRVKGYTAEDLAVLACACEFNHISEVSKNVLKVGTSLDLPSGYLGTILDCGWIHIRAIPFDEIEYIDVVETRESVKTTATKFNEVDYIINGGFFCTYKEPQFNMKIRGRTLKTYPDHKWGMIFTKNRIRYGELSQGNTFISGHPVLLDNSEFCDYKYASEIDGERQRTAMGYDDRYLYLVVCDKTKGLTLRGLRQIMKHIGCTYAINLDGGGSSSLFQKGKEKNRQTDQRRVNNCIFIKLKSDY